MLPQRNCPVCGRSLPARAATEGSTPAPTKVEQLWSGLVCSEECFRNLSFSKARPLSEEGTPLPPASPMRKPAAAGPPAEGTVAALPAAPRVGEEASPSLGRVIQFSQRPRRVYVRPGSDRHLHMPEQHSPESLASLLRLAEAAGPASTFTRMVAGVVLESMGLHEQALEELSEALRIDPTNSSARLHLAFVLERLARRREAARHFETLLAEQPRWAEAHLGLGITHYGEGDAEGAIEEFNRALQIDPLNLCALLNKAVAYSNQGLFYLAEKVLCKVIELHPDSGEGHLYLGAILLEQGELEPAAQRFRRAIEIDGRRADAHYYLGETYLRTGKRDTALVQFRRAVELRPRDPDGHYKIGLILLEDGNVQGALISLRRTLELDEGDLEARFHLGMALSMAGDVEGALKELSAVQAVAPEMPEANLCLAYLYYKRGQHERAMRLFETYREARVELADHLLRLAGLKK